MRAWAAKAMLRSEAESIYRTWTTASSRQAVTRWARATGKFDAFRKTGFDEIVARLAEHQQTRGTYKTAEQAWKLLDKYRRRHGTVVARELMKVLQADPRLSGIFAQFPGSTLPGLSSRAKQSATALDPSVVVFPTTGKEVRLLGILGEGSMSNAVFLGEDQHGDRYAVKHIARGSHGIPGFDGDTAVDRFRKTQHHLEKYAEAALTPTCLDALVVGRDEYLLLELGEGTIDYSTLNMSDIVSAFEDLRRSYAFSRHYMAQDMAQDVGVLHTDIHGGNLTRIGGKLRLIDYGLAMVFDERQHHRIRSAVPVADNRDNQNLYLQKASLLSEKQAFYDPRERTTWRRYIEEWQRAIGDGRYACRPPLFVDSRQYGCVELTVVLIKEIWAAIECGRDLGMGGGPATMIPNIKVYAQARRGMPRIKESPQAAIIELLLQWFDEMMRRIIDGEPFSAADAIRFFGSADGSQASRLRRHSVSF
jgi:hypothetical protein